MSEVIWTMLHAAHRPFPLFSLITKAYEVELKFLYLLYNKRNALQPMVILQCQIISWYCLVHKEECVFCIRNIAITAGLAAVASTYMNYMKLKICPHFQS
jgi:hypothetical protein